jgi:hypothetical protein
MVFYVAKGAPDACGPGCSQWIAAEGAFDAGSPARLRALLAKPHTAGLPIYFHSPGGLADRAFAIGRLMRERGIVAGVSRTLPDACRKLSDRACAALKRSGKPLAAELRAIAVCNSACVYALVGAKERDVPPGARLGVHAARLIKLYSDGRVAVMNSAAATGRARDAQMRRYIAEMGVDVRLLDIAAKIPHEKVYYLSRDEIASLRIDQREFRETGWMVVPSNPVSVRKLFIEAKGRDRKEFRVGIVDLSCAAPGRAGVVYIRGLASGDNAKSQAIGLMVDGREIPMSGLSEVSRLDFVDTGSWFDRWGRVAARDLLDQLAAADTLAIATGPAGAPLQAAGATKLSTAGLSHAVGTLRQRCETERQSGVQRQN